MSVGMGTPLSFAALTLLVIAATETSYAKQCFDVSKGEPKSLSGVLEYVLFAGPPNFEDVQKGDTPEPNYILRVDHPICIKGDDFSDPSKMFDRVQVVGSDAIWPALKRSVGREVTLSLKDQMGAMTGHHHEPLVAWITRIQITDRALSFTDEYGTPATMIRTFYEALSDGQGDIASAMVIPEKREKGPFAAASLTNFYGRLKQPISLTSIYAAGPTSFIAHYTYATAKKFCNGSAQVQVSVKNGRNYIESIKALNGC